MMREGRTFSVVAEAHLGLAQADRVFALADAVELLELGLVHALSHKSGVALLERSRTYLAREVQLHGFNAHILGSLCHC